MQPKNMSYYCRPRVTTWPDDTVDKTDAAHCQAVVSALLIDKCCGLCHHQISLLHLATLRKQHRKRHVLYTTMNSLLCSAGPPVQLGHVLLSGRPFSSTIQNLNLPFHVWLEMQPLWVQPINIPGIHILPSHLQQCYRSPKPHSCIRWHISNPWLFDPLSSFSNNKNDHYILTNSGWNYLKTPSDTIIIDNYCHDTPRPQWP